MSSKAKVPSLDAFVEENPSRPGFNSYIDTDVPEDVRDQLVASNAGHAQAVRWLHRLGYTRVTVNMLTAWRSKRGWRRT